MSTLPPVHLTVMQPAGYVHSLGFLDQARYVRHQLRRFGASVTLGKNRLREDAVNIVFGAHLGFPAAMRERHACMFFNLEQLGEGGAQVPADYLQLLQTSAVIDYDPHNVPAYTRHSDDVPIATFQYAPYLQGTESTPLQERPIDLLFFGSMNARRRQFIERIEACGLSVSTFDAPIYGPERDAYIRQAKAVINCSFYESSRFEQVRVSHCLSLGTPVISHRSPRSAPPAAFEDAVFWVDDNTLESFFTTQFGTPAFFEMAQERLQAFQRHDPLEQYADLMAFAKGFKEGFDQLHRPLHWAPQHLNLDTRNDYRLGWLNVDDQDASQPDLQLDLGAPLSLPLDTRTRMGVATSLEAGTITRIHAGEVPSQVEDLEMFMSNALALLADEGVITVEVPMERAPSSWTNPRMKRALNEHSWRYFTEGFWRLGWLTHRFELEAVTPLDLHRRPSARESAAYLRVDLRKVTTTARERTLARTMLSDFGGVEEDTGAPTAPPCAPLQALTPALPPAETRTPATVSDRTARLPEVEAQVDALIANDQMTQAMVTMANAINAHFMQDGVAHHALYYPVFDQQLCRMAARLAEHRPMGEVPATHENHLFIASELYQIGGHSKVLEDMSRMVRNPVIVLTDTFGNIASHPEQYDWIEAHYAHAQVLVLPEATLWQKAEMLRDLACRLQSGSITYFNHHQDPVPFVGTLEVAGSRKLLVHHCDHNPSLGCTLPQVRHVDITLKLQDTCSAHRQSPTDILRLFVADQGCKPMAPVTDMAFNVVTAGRAGKFSHEGPVSLQRLIATTLQTIEGRHIHIGPLSPAWLRDIEQHLSAQGIDPSRFVHVGAVPSLWTTLKQLDAAVYIGSAPVSGGRGAIEAQGCGYPVLPFMGFEEGSLLADYSSYADLSLGWADLDALRTQLLALPPHHAALCTQARAFYDAHFSLAQFHDTVQALTQA
jgi:hypothetical protein